MLRRFKLILFPTMTLLFVSSISFVYLLKQNQNQAIELLEKEKMRAEVFETKLQALANQAQRLPASLPPTEATLPTVADKVSFQTSLKMSCDDILSENLKNNMAKVASDHVIIRMNDCLKNNLNAKSIRLINSTNGYNAQVFQLSRQDLNTDFIQLNPGENRLEFEISLNAGQKKTQIFKINRIQ